MARSFSTIQLQQVYKSKVLDSVMHSIKWTVSPKKNKHNVLLGSK